MYHVKFKIGDRSYDGHNMCEDFIYVSNLEIEKVNEAYREAVKITGIDFTKLCSEFEDNIIPTHVSKLLSQYGINLWDFDCERINVDRGYNYDFYIYPDEFMDVLAEFIKLGNEELVIHPLKIDDEFSYSVGYGLFHG